MCFGSTPPTWGRGQLVLLKPLGGGQQERRLQEGSLSMKRSLELETDGLGLEKGKEEDLSRAGSNLTLNSSQEKKASCS